MTWQGRAAAGAVVVSSALASGDVLPPQIGLPLIALSVIAAWRYTSGFWRMVGFGLVGGLVAGLLILGPGFRAAMRVVAIMDPFRATEFSLEGTAFIVIGIGGIFGAITGISGNLLRAVFSIRSAIGGGALLGALLIADLLRTAEFRSEFFDLGGGAWVNIPMFGLIAIGYGIAAMAVADHLSGMRRTEPVIESEKVPA